MQADGLWDLENDRDYGDSTDLGASPTYTTFGPSTTPNSKWWDGTHSNLTISNVSAAGATVAGLPADGTSSVYVRLNSYINGVWYHNDYVYTAGNGGGGVDAAGAADVDEATDALDNDAEGEVASSYHPEPPSLAGSLVEDEDSALTESEGTHDDNATKSDELAANRDLLPIAPGCGIGITPLLALALSGLAWTSTHHRQRT